MLGELVVFLRHTGRPDFFTSSFTATSCHKMAHHYTLTLAIDQHTDTRTIISIQVASEATNMTSCASHDTACLTGHRVSHRTPRVSQDTACLTGHRVSHRTLCVSQDTACLTRHHVSHMTPRVSQDTVCLT